MFHPHHILFTPIIHMLYKLASGVCESCDAIFTAQVHNILWAVAGITASYWVAKPFAHSRFFPLILPLLMGASNGILMFSTQVEVYIPASACLMMATAILFQSGRRPLSIAESISIVTLLSLSVLYHQTNVLFCLPLAFFLIASRGKAGGKSAAAILFSSGGVVLSIYVIAFLHEQIQWSLTEFIRFCTAYAYHPNPTWGTFDNFSVKGIGRLLDSQLRNLIYVPQDRSIPRYVSVAIFGMGMAALLVASIYGILRKRSNYHETAFLLAWLFTYYLFFLWWLPGEEEFFVVTILPTLLLGVLAVKDLKIPELPKSAPYVLIAMLATFNFIKTVIPAYAEKGESYAISESISRHIEPGCMVYSEYHVLQNLAYYFGLDNGQELPLKMLLFYQGSTVPDTNVNSNMDCYMVAPPTLAAPSYKIADYDGLSNPEGWRKFISWLFDYKKGSDDAPPTYREFEIIDGSGEKAALVFRTKRRENGDMDSLLSKIGEATRQ